jgi:hypothetical protein
MIKNTMGNHENIEIYWKPMKNNEKTTLIPPTPPKKNYENHKQTTM